MKAQDMADKQYFAHTSPEGLNPWHWFEQAGYEYEYAGENLAVDFTDSSDVARAWMNSPTHRENLLKKEYVDVGFAVVSGELNGKKTTLVVALYGAPAVAVAATATQQTPQPTFSASKVATETQNPLAYFGTTLEALSPVTIGVLGLLAVVAIVGVLAHHHRAKLPKALKKSWRMHHGMYTFLGMITLGVLIIVATGGGSI
jgi:hypothetical protein